MGQMIDINGSFEQGWKHGIAGFVENGWHFVVQPAAGDLPGIQEIKLPASWVMRWADATVTNPYWDGNDYNLFQRPEFDLKQGHQLPEHEQDLLVLDGEWTFKPFLSGAWMAELLYGADLPAGEYRFTVNFYPDVVKAYNPDGTKVFATDNAAFTYFVFNGARSAKIDGTPINETESRWLTRFFQFRADGPTVFGLGFMCPWALKNSGFWCDNWKLERLDDEPIGQYERTAHLLPQELTWSEFIEAGKVAFEPRETITRSAADAFLNDEKCTKRTVHVWNVERWGGQEALEDWVHVTHPPMPDEVTYREFGGPAPTPSPSPSWPPPSSLGEPITLHRQTNVDGLYEYIAKVKPAWVKLVGGFEDAQRVKDISPDTKVLIRHVTDHQGQYLDSCDVNAFLAQFSDSLEANARWIDAFEGLNEEAPNDKLVRFAVALSNETRRRYGNDIAACLLNLSVGNGEPGILLPVAQACDDNGHYFGYHAYNPVNLENAEKWLLAEDVAKWYHFRALLYLDPYFRQHGAFPHYLFTEAGAVRADTRPDGGVGGLDPAGGWRAVGALNGDRERYINLLLSIRTVLGLWNAKYNNRAEAHMLFTVGDDFVGWLKWKLKTPDMDALAEALA